MVINMLRMISAMLVVIGFSIIVLTWIASVSPDLSVREYDYGDPVETTEGNIE